ncbi:lasso peptide biosynthesis protein [Chloroflexota bacterium]
MFKNRALISAISAILLAGLLTGCGASTDAGGNTADSQASQEQLAALQAKLKASDGKVASLQTELEVSQGKVTDLQKQVMELAEESELTGTTAADTAANIIRLYHETHSYSKTDLFVCADMSMDVWSMLQAQGIPAVIKIGSVEQAILNMEDSGHAWVLAETSPGNYLALETTNGQVVSREQNPLYYAGWSFENPREYKRFEELKYEHNIRVNLLNQLIGDAQDVNKAYDQAYTVYQGLVNEYNSTYAGQPSSGESQNSYDSMNAQLAVVKELEGRRTQLDILMAEQQQDLEKIVPQMQALAH